MVEFPDGHPQEGRLVVDQDLVNYDLHAADLADAAQVDDSQLCIAEAYCLYGAKADAIFRNINRREKAKGNANVVFELALEMDDHSELVVKRSWCAGAVSDPKPRDLNGALGNRARWQARIGSEPGDLAGLQTVGCIDECMKRCVLPIFTPNTSTYRERKLLNPLNRDR